MGIHTHIDPLDPDDLDADAAAAADELLAQVLSDYARERVREANEANRQVAGDYVPYTVEVDGKVYQGRGEIFPENQIAAFRPQPKSERERIREANVALGRKIRAIVVEWLWEKASTRLLSIAIRTLARLRHGADRIESLNAFGRIVAGGEVNDLLLYLLEQMAARRSKWFRGASDLKALYNLYRLIARARDELGGDDDAPDAEMLRWIASELMARSPVVSGTYRSAHTLFADGAEVGSAEDVAAGAAIPDAAEYVFVNPEPYARKIEVGKTRAGRDFVLQVPNRIYERTAADAKNRFGGSIRSEWRDEASLPASTRGKDRPLRFPAIVIEI